MTFIFESGVLKRAARTGWWFAGVKHPESIAEHSFRTAFIGMMLAAMEGADPARVSMLCVLHDTQKPGSRAALKTASAHRLADAALNGQPLAWLTPPRPAE
ncbi:HD domain-containing protein [Micromonospora sp. NPDC005707]|uniref:HD domain-containing protein n=1 Tax=Micromonospora sp. NPDC005707 TaxID=3157050 RepID=UPI0033DA2E0B